MEEGLFAVRRNDKLFWSGTWSDISDMTIEQCLMRAGKTQGGLINITHKEAARTKWLLTAHVVAQYIDAVQFSKDHMHEAGIIYIHDIIFIHDISTFKRIRILKSSKYSLNTCNWYV